MHSAVLAEEVGEPGVASVSVVAVPVAEAAALSLRAMLGAIAEAHGLAGAVYIHLGHGFRGRPDPGEPAAPRRLIATGGGFDEVQYARRGYLGLDPLAERAARSYAPFAWRLEGLDDGGDRGRLLGVMANWGMHEGVVVPVQDYALGPALLNLFGSRCGPVDHGALMLAAVRVHHAASTLPELGRTSTDILLNPREMEVLRLAAVGSTEQETAFALALSRRGVQFHLARAIEKIGAPNKTAAVARAVAAGLIRF